MNGTHEAVEEIGSICCPKGLSLSFDRATVPGADTPSALYVFAI
jgi:hypothetical protein